MLSIVYFVFLVSCSALSQSENEALSVWWEPEMPSHSETSHSLMDGYGNMEFSRGRPKIIFCCACQEVVKRAKKAVSQKLQKKINTVCYKYIEPFRKICFQRAMKYRDIILHKIFPGGNPRSTCVKIKLC
ncbi:hypothetical protein ABG768_009818 [Culter alburnus]|uniref:Saposin B-type domain-containing protein n=1 Tax=Culter alburnus TaxID=194366 RepID=A0AAW1ZFM1_CULAL